jgi:hypothetical protein
MEQLGQDQSVVQPNQPIGFRQGFSGFSSHFAPDWAIQNEAKEKTRNLPLPPRMHRMRLMAGTARKPAGFVSD